MPIVGAYEIATIVGGGSSVAVSCAFLSVLFYLFETLGFLGRNIKVRYLGRYLPLPHHLP